MLENDHNIWIGTLAGICTTIAFIPQLLKVLKTKSAEDVSSALLVIFSLGVALWLVYGILKDDLPMIFFNGLTLILALWIFFLKRLYSKRNRSL